MEGGLWDLTRDVPRSYKATPIKSGPFMYKIFDPYDPAPENFCNDATDTSSLH